MKPTHASQPVGRRGALGPRRPGVVVAIVAVIALIGALFTSVFAGAQPVGNPGGFNLKIEGGEIWIKDTDFDLTPNPLPACSDGEDNDEDGATDYPADAQCASPDDNSEVAPGGQPKEDITIAGSIDANGAVNVPTSGIYFPPAYIEQGGDLLTARIQPTAAGTGSLNPMTGAATLSISLRIKLEGSPQGVSLGSSCIIGPFSLSLTTGTSGSLTGIGYNPDTGLATMVTNTFAVPAAGGCGPLGLANGPINDALGLPAGAGTSKATLLGSMTPIITRGVTSSFTPNVTSGFAPLTVNFNGTASSAVKPIASYAWDFGNGQTATGATAFTTYPAVGEYDVSLTVTDTDGTSHSTTQTITVTERPNQAPSAVIAASGTTGNAPFTLNVDGSASSDSDGTIASYAWDFGNGETATGATASTTYADEGTYTVTLTVTDDKGATGTTTRQITVNPTPNVAPTAVIRTVSASGTIPLTVNLSATNSTDSDGSVVGYAWDLGNGTTSTAPTVQAVYTEAGTYTVTLTVTDDDGDTGVQQLEIEVSEDPNLAPSAAFSTSPTTGVAPLTVSVDGSGSEDIDGSIVSYAWNFGNGQNASGATASATYSLPGTYQVRLTVTDNRGATSTATETVTVSAPPNQSPVAAVAASPNAGAAPLLVRLSSAGTTDPDGSISSYAWDFGNGSTSTQPNPTAVYNTPGTYLVSLTVTDNEGATNIRTTTVTVGAVNQLPTASIVASALTGPAPLTVNVNGANSVDPDGSIVSYAWSFGNGQTATGPTASVTYTTAASYQIRLTVTDNNGGTRSVTTTVVVSGANVAPVASFTALPTSGPAPLLVQVDATSSVDPDGSIASYRWDFGNGVTATGARTQVTYPVAGNYVLKLTVTDNRGATHTATETIIVDPPVVQRDRVKLQFSGGLNYLFDGQLSGGNVFIGRDGSGITNISGGGTYAGPGGSTASVNFDISRFLWFNSYLGSVNVYDDANGVFSAAGSMWFGNITRPSATSARGTVAGSTSNGLNFNLAFTVDDRA